MRSAPHTPLSSAMASSSPTVREGDEARLDFDPPVDCSPSPARRDGGAIHRSSRMSAGPALPKPVGLRMALSKERGNRASCGSSLFAETATGFSSLFPNKLLSNCKKKLSQSRKERKGKDNKEIGKAVVGAAILQSGEKPLHPKNSLAILASWREEFYIVVFRRNWRAHQEG